MGFGSGVLSAFVSAARRAGSQALDLAYPPVCIACRATTVEPATVCARCWGQIRFIERPYCERLGTPFTHDLGAGVLSPEAIANPPAYQRARAVARYEEGPVSRLVSRLKYSDRVELAEPMGRWMARAGEELLRDDPILVPVPLHHGRLFRRRFNQASALAHVVARHYSLDVDALVLQRLRPTVPQVGLTRAQRALNVQGAMSVPKAARSRLAGRNIVLIDDVLTSGATTDASARALLRAGAERVDVLVFARVVRDA